MLFSENIRLARFSLDLFFCEKILCTTKVIQGFSLKNSTFLLTKYFIYNKFIMIFILRKGKVTERRRRKTMGLQPKGHDSQVAEG